MRTCPQCHEEVADNAAFCTKCGAKMPQQAAGTGAGTGANAGDNAGAAQGAGTNTGNANAGATYVNAATYANAGQNAGQTAGANQGAAGHPNGQYYQAPVDIYDHTAEFDAKDISDNKVIAMIVYLMGTAGIIIALLASHTSPYAAFHVRQSLKITVLNILLGLVGVILCWTFIVPIAVGLMALALFIVRIICFFQICGGKAKEPFIVRNFRFMR